MLYKYLKPFAIIGVVIGSVALASCTTTDDAVANLNERLDVACGVAPAAHVAFLAITEHTDISEEIVKREAQAYTIIHTVCQDRPENTQEALQTVLSAYQNILALSEEAVEST